MPYKDPEKRKEKNREYARAYAERQAPKPAGVCSVVGCGNATQGGHRKCEHHLEYMRQYKQLRRSEPKAAGLCSNSDCTNKARPGFKLCEGCNERSKANARTPEARSYRLDRDRAIKLEVLSSYGGSCVCCGEGTEEFLSIDHIDGYSDGPRKGSSLYRWLKRNNFPAGFRVLCMSCNFTLGHHGYCPHGDLTQENRSGRPRTLPDDASAVRRAVYRRTYHEGLKLDACSAYGGPVCRCCGEDHLECLQIDHINDDGAAHRKELTGNPQDGRNLYIWLRQNGYPPGFQVLCANCNFAKGHFGVCPHERT